MNKEDFINWVNLNDQVFAIARSRIKARNIVNISYIHDSEDYILVSYVPEKARSCVPDLKAFTIEEFVGE